MKSAKSDRRKIVKWAGRLPYLFSSCGAANDLKMAEELVKLLQPAAFYTKDDGMHCGACDARILYHHKFCPQCGTEVSNERTASSEAGSGKDR